MIMIVYGQVEQSGKKAIVVCQNTITAFTWKA